MRYPARSGITALVLLVSLISLSGCTVKYVADYDASIKAEIIELAKTVDLFWGQLLDTDPAARSYADFKDRYNVIESEMRALVMKNEIRALNEESTQQANNALKLWVEDRALHRQNDTFSDFEAKRHRRQFIDVFTAMAKGEEAKNI